METLDWMGNSVTDTLGKRCRGETVCWLVSLSPRFTDYSCPPCLGWQQTLSAISLHNAARYGATNRLLHLCKWPCSVRTGHLAVWVQAPCSVRTNRLYWGNKPLAADLPRCLKAISRLYACPTTLKLANTKRQGVGQVHEVVLTFNISITWEECSTSLLNGL